MTAHIFAGLTSHFFAHRQLSLDVLALLLQKFPRLCSENREIYDQFLLALKNDGGWKTHWRKNKLLFSIGPFLTAYGHQSPLETALWPTVSVELSVETGMVKEPAVSFLPHPAAIDFPIFGPTNASSTFGPAQTANKIHRPLLSVPQNLVDSVKVLSAQLLILLDDAEANTKKKCEGLVIKMINLAHAAHKSPGFSEQQTHQLKQLFSPFLTRFDDENKSIEDRLSFLFDN
jgi:hypothetical protein